MVTVNNTEIEGLRVVNNFHVNDNRGVFVKTYNKNQFANEIGVFELRESYYSISHKNVIRGMHFQIPPFDHGKLVYVTSGAILDVVVDLRKESKTYGHFFTIEISLDNKKSIFIPSGFAHGFMSLMDNTTTVYNVSTEYNPSFDKGVLYNSFGFNWPGQNHILSERDLAFPGLEAFFEENPF